MTSIRLKYNFLFLFLFYLKDCWQIHPHERPIFNDLVEQINTIIEINHMESNEESYQLLKNNWRQEI